MINVFIDGSAGTTGLRIRERLSARKDIELIILPEETRKDPAARADALNSAAVSFLCLPDAAAIEAASFVTSPDAVIIDTSTAHRVAEGWTYGMPELTGQREKGADRPAGKAEGSQTHRQSRLPCHRFHFSGGSSYGSRPAEERCPSVQFLPYRLFRRRKKDDRGV